MRFDRPLWPEPVGYESVRVYSGTPRNRVSVRSIRYDLLNWTLRYGLGGRLTARALYQVELPGAGGTTGPRAFDGGALEPGAIPLAFSFFTADSASSNLPADAPAPSCAEIVPVFERHCSSGCCHGGDSPAMGLRLDSRDGLMATAIGRVAHQTETAGTVGLPHSHPERFGTAMPLIDPGSAATSYLVYKLLIAPGEFEPCADESCAPFTTLPGAERCAPWPEAERSRLRDWFVRGEAMPLAPWRAGCSEDEPSRPLDCASLHALVRFVDAGAACE